MTEDQIYNLVHSTVNRCTEFFYDTGLVKPNWSVQTTISFCSRRVNNWGGVRANGQPFISLALNSYLNTSRESFHEYVEFANDKLIGSIYNSTNKSIRALTMHELSHAVELSNPTKAARAIGMRLTQKDLVGHGELWKNIYSFTRENLL